MFSESEFLNHEMGVTIIDNLYFAYLIGLLQVGKRTKINDPEC